RLRRRPRREERIAGVQCSVSEFEIEIPMVIAGSGLCDDFGAAETDAAEFRTVRIVADADFLNLILRRNPSTGEPVDNKCRTATGCASSSRDLGEVIGQIVFIIRQSIDEILLEYRRLEAGIGIDTDFVSSFGYVDILSDGCKLHCHGEGTGIAADF